MTRVGYAWIRSDLRQQIVTGLLRAGDRLDTEHNLARHYGVAVLTVRRALQGLVDEGLIYRKQRHGTFITEQAAKHRRILLVCGLSGLSGHSLTRGVSQYHQNSIRFCQQAALDLGFTFETLWQYAESPNPPEEAGQARLATASGVIFLACPSNNPLIAHAMRQGTHTVNLGKTTEGERNVWFDMYQAAEIAVVPVIEEIKRQRMSVVVASVQGEARGADAFVNWFPGRTLHLQIPSNISLWDVERNGYRAIHQLCAQMDKPLAFVFLDDVVARGGTRALLERGLGGGRCPVVVVSGKQEMAPYGLPVIHVTHDTEAEARWAVEMLAAQMEGCEGGTAPRQSRFALDTFQEPEPGDWMKELGVEISESRREVIGNR